MYPEFLQSFFDGFAIVDFNAPVTQKGFDFTAKLKEFPTYKFAARVYCIENPTYLPFIEVVRTLPISLEERKMWQELHNEKTHYPCFLFVIDTSQRKIYYYQLTFNAINSWVGYPVKEFYWWISTEKCLHVDYPTPIIYDILRSKHSHKEDEIEEERIDKQFYFPILNEMIDETTKNIISTQYCYNFDKLLAAYEAVNELPASLRKTLISLFIGSTNSYYLGRLVDICTKYNLHEIIPFLLPKVEFLITTKSINYDKKYIDEGYYKPFLNALIIFDVRESGLYPQLRYFLRYYNEDLSSYIGLVAFILALPEAEPDFEKGILPFPTNFGLIRGLWIDEMQLTKAFQKYLQKNVTPIIRAKILDEIGYNLSSTEICNYLHDKDAEVQEAAKSKIKWRLGHLISPKKNLDETEQKDLQTYLQALGYNSLEEYKNTIQLSNKEYKDNQQLVINDILDRKEYHQLLDNHSLIYSLDEVTKCKVFVVLCELSDKWSIYTPIKINLLRSWNNKAAFSDEAQEVFLAYLPTEIVRSTNYEYLYHLMNLANKVQIPIDITTVYKKWEQGYIALYAMWTLSGDIIIADLPNYLQEKNLTLSQFIQVVAFTKNTLLWEQLHNDLEKQALKLLENIHLFYNISFLKTLHQLPTSTISNKIFEVLKIQDINSFYQHNEEELSCIEHYIVILCKSQRLIFADYLIELCEQEIASYKNFILHQLLIYYPIQTEQWLQSYLSKKEDYRIRTSFFQYLNAYEDIATG